MAISITLTTLSPLLFLPGPVATSNCRLSGLNIECCTSFFSEIGVIANSPLSAFQIQTSHP